MLTRRESVAGVDEPEFSAASLVGAMMVLVSEDTGLWRTEVVWLSLKNPSLKLLLSSERS
jgi:hypothetical protein